MKKRLDWIDLCRGLGIIVMVAGHVGLPYTVDKYIHAWHMPIFFILSGYLYKEITAKELIIKRSKTLLIPYLSFGLLLYTISFIQNLITHNTDMFKQLFDLFTFNTIGKLPYGNSLWFLTCIFAVEIIFNFIKTSVKSEEKIFLIVILIAMIGYVFSFTEHRLVWGIDTALTSVFFYYFGYILKKYQNSKLGHIIFNPNLIVFLILFGIGTILEQFNGYVNLRLIQYDNIILFYLNAILISLAILMFCIFIIQKQIFSLFFKPIIYIGQNSLIYLGLNQFVIRIIRKLPVHVNKPIFGVVVLFLTLVLISFVSIIINRYFAWMAGKSIIKEKKEIRLA